MPEKTISDDQGEIFRLIARTKTTPRANESIKSINTDSDTIKVLVFDAIMTSAGSQFGHVAIDIDGTIYSRAHSKYAILSDGMQYRKSNQLIRSFEELILRVSREEKMKIETELKRRVEVDKRTASSTTAVRPISQTCWKASAFLRMTRATCLTQSRPIWFHRKNY